MLEPDYESPSGPLFLSQPLVLGTKKAKSGRYSWRESTRRQLIYRLLVPGSGHEVTLEPSHKVL